MHLVSFPSATWSLRLWLSCCFLLATSSLLAQDRFAANNRSRDVAATALGSTWQGSDWLSSAQQKRQEWRLGIRGDNTETGILIREVTRNSAAAKAGIEVGDYIISVEGFQVGIVSGRLYDLTEELNRRANAYGVVSLLVQDHVSGRLASIRAQLDGTQNTLSGTLIYRERAPLPSDAIVTVQIENVTRPYFVVRNGQYSFRPMPGASIPFEIAYDPNYINAQDTYRVRAFVSSGQRTILDTPQPPNVITQGNPSQVRLELAPLSGSNLASNSGTSGVVTAGYPNYNELDDQISKMYRQYLGRYPTTLELAALHQTPGIAARMNTMPLELMAAQEFFDLAGNNNAVWLQNVFEKIVKRRPTQTELDQWMQRYAELRYSRTELLRQLDMQVRR